MLPDRVDDSPYVMSPTEVAWGYPLGHIGTLAPPSDPTAGPRQALERVVRVALERPPCGVAFSGGRDSSLVLAVAAHVARRDGLPEPVPITWIFPDVAESEEVDWQETVIRHLGLSNWQRLVFHDELDVIGPLAAAHLVEHGVLWPPTLANDRPLLETVHGGSLLDGEGGDEVLGVAAHRVAPLTRVFRAPRTVRRRHIRAALGALAPAAARGRQARRRFEQQPITWLRPAARDGLLEALKDAERHRPLSFATSVRMVPCRRTQVLLARNRRILARQYEVEVSSPLLDPGFVHALAGDGGLLGPGDRTAALRRLAPDLLPDEVLARTSKATFTRCFMGRATREFAEGWAGDGVDADLVDPDELRRIWRGATPVAPTAALLQSAWLGSQVSARAAGRG